MLFIVYRPAGWVEYSDSEVNFAARDKNSRITKNGWVVVTIGSNAVEAPDDTEAPV